MINASCVKCGSTDMIVQLLAGCGHYERYCIDDLPEENPEKCHECHKREQKFPKCYCCEKNLECLDAKTCKLFDFKNSTDSNPLIQVCKDCIISYYKNKHNKDKKKCYYCNINLDGGNLLYFREDSKKCKKDTKHQQWLCQGCKGIWNLVESTCFECEDFLLDKEICEFCKQEITDFSMKTAGNDCINRAGHKFSICTKCSENGDALLKNFKCKYCVNKQATEIAIFKLVTNFVDDFSIPIFKLVSAKIEKDNQEIDEESYPSDFNFSLIPALIEKTTKDQFMLAVINEACSAIAIQNYAIVTGGYVADELGVISAQNTSMMISFVKDGFYKVFNVEKLGQIQQQRYFHSTFYCEEMKSIFIIGGIEVKQPNNELKWINSVESTKFDPQNPDTDFVWKSSGTLLKARSNFNGFVFGTKIYVYGGVNGIDTNENTIEEFDCQKNKSVYINLKNKPTSFTWPAFSTCTVLENNKVLVLGGSVKGVSQQGVYQVDVEKKDVTEHSKLNKPRSGFFSLKTKDPSRLIVFGGDDCEEGLTTETFELDQNDKNWSLKEFPNCLEYHLHEDEETFVSNSLSFQDSQHFVYQSKNLDAI